METKRQYFSLVSDRISALIEELKQAENKLEEAKQEKNKRKIAPCKLEIKFLNYKIEYLERLKDLPLYIVISELSTDQLREIRSNIGKLGFTLEETRAYLMDKLGLHEIPSLIKHSDISSLAQIDNYETILKLAIIQKRNGNYKQQKRDLQRELEIPEELCLPKNYQVFDKSGKTKPLFYYEIDYVKKKVATYSERLEQVMNILRSNYSISKIEEIRFYLEHSTELSRTFIETHMEKVVAKYPEEKATIKYLLQSKKSSLFDKFSAKKRRNREQRFLNCLVDCYRNDGALSFFEVDVDLFTLSRDELRTLFTKIKNEAIVKKGKIKELNQNIRVRQNEILNTARDYNLLQADAKERFSEIIYSEIKTFQKAWLHWLWQVPDLMEVFMKGHTLAEVETLVDCLKDPFPYYKEEELVNQIVYTLKQKRS